MTTSTPTPTAAQAEAMAAESGPVASHRSKSAAVDWFVSHGILVVFAGVLALAFVVDDGFYRSANLWNLLSQNAALGIVAVGMTFVIMAGGFDLSAGAIFAAGATLYAGLAVDLTLPLAGAAALVVGGIAGAINGLVVTRLGVNTFVATLGTASAFRGLAFLLSDSAPQLVDDETFRNLGRGRLGPAPISGIIFVSVFVVGSIVLRRTVFGRSIYAVGGNADAARLAGMNVALIRTATYVIAGVASTLAGMIVASRIGLGQADIGNDIALDSIAVVVIGGTSLLGGEGAMWRTGIGLMMLAVLTNLFDLVGLDSNLQLVVKGVIIIGAVSLDNVEQRRSR